MVKKKVTKKKVKRVKYNVEVITHPDGFEAIKLEDGTMIVLGNKPINAVAVMYPKKKFARMIRKQLKDRKNKYVGFQYNETELMAITCGLESLLKDTKRRVKKNERRTKPKRQSKRRS